MSEFMLAWQILRGVLFVVKVTVLNMSENAIYAKFYDDKINQ